MHKSASFVLTVALVAVVALASGYGQSPPAGQAPPGQAPAAGAAPIQRGPTYVAPPRLAVREIQDDLFQIAWGLDSTCMYVLVGRDKALVVDTQTMPEFEGKRIIDYVKSITDKPLIVVNTHPHRDHIAGNAQFGEAHLFDADPGPQRGAGDQALHQVLHGSGRQDHRRDRP